MTNIGLGYDDNVYDLNTILYPSTVFDHPRDVLSDDKLSVSEKRAILASWASDAGAVISCPSLREIPGQRKPVLIDDIFDALSSLDGEPRPPGGKPVRRFSTSRVAA